MAFGAGTGTAALGAVTGFLYLTAFILLQKNVDCNGVILSGAAMKLGGVLIPIIAAVLLFQERMKWVQIAGAILAIAAIVLINRSKEAAGRGGKKQWLAVLPLVSIPNYYSARFLLLSLGSVLAVIAYPVFSVGTIVVISAAGVVFFHESLSWHKKGALLLIRASLILLNM